MCGRVGWVGRVGWGDTTTLGVRTHWNSRAERVWRGGKGGGRTSTGSDKTGAKGFDFFGSMRGADIGIEGRVLVEDAVAAVATNKNKIRCVCIDFYGVTDLGAASILHLYALGF